MPGPKQGYDMHVAVTRHDSLVLERQVTLFRQLSSFGVALDISMHIKTPLGPSRTAVSQHKYTFATSAAKRACARSACGALPGAAT